MNTTPNASIAGHPERIHEPRTVLVAEDDCAVRELFTIILRHLGYKALSAASAQEALEIAQAWRGEPIDLLITDLSMPYKDGNDLAEEMCALLPELKVMFISGYAADDPVAINLDFDHSIYVPKPAGSHTVQKAIRALFCRTPAAMKEHETNGGGIVAHEEAAA